MFDTLKYAKKLQEVGVPREQAEAQIIILVEVMEDTLATKTDLKELGAGTREEFQAVRTELQSVRSEMRSEFQAVRSEIKVEIVNLEHRLTLRVGAMAIAIVGAVAAIHKLL